MYQALTLSTLSATAAHAEVEAATSPMWIDAASACLHAASGLQVGQRICRNTILTVHLAIHHLVAIRIASGEVEEIDAGKDDQKAAKKRDRVDRVDRIESLEEDKRRTERSGGKSNIVEWIHDRSRELAQRFVEIIHLRHDTDGCDNHEDIGRREFELVVARQGEFDGDAECFDGHDRDRSDRRADR